MARPVVHFEVIGKDPEQLRRYYRDLFGWTFETPSPVVPEVSDPDNYGFIDLLITKWACCRTLQGSRRHADWRRRSRLIQTSAPDPVRERGVKAGRKVDQLRRLKSGPQGCR
jgi:hypothetical protein